LDVCFSHFVLSLEPARSPPIHRQYFIMPPFVAPPGPGNRYQIPDKLSSLIARSLCMSSWFNPRHLEHFEYIHYLSDAQACTAGSPDLHVTAQFPIWRSPKDKQLDHGDVDVDASFATTADVAAKGVYTDLATILIHVAPHPEANLEMADLMASLSSLLTAHGYVDPRIFSVVQVEAITLYEIKRGPWRHPTSVESFLRRLEILMTSAQSQSQTQGLFLFCSIRFAQQDEVLLVAGAGDYWSLSHMTRSQAQAIKSKYTSEQLIEQGLALSEDTSTIDLEEEEIGTDDVFEEVGDDLAEPVEVKSLLKEQWVKQKLASEKKEAELRKRQNEARDARFLARSDKKEVTATAEIFSKKTSPSSNRWEPPFPDATVDEYAMLKRNHKVFEEVSPEVYLKAQSTQAAAQPNALKWTGYLHLGSLLSDQYLRYIAKYQGDRAAAARKVGGWARA
jgi:hypothetical protein